MLLTLLVAIKNVVLGVFVGGFLMYISLKKDTQAFTNGTESSSWTLLKFIFRVVLFAAVCIFLIWVTPKVLL